MEAGAGEGGGRIEAGAREGGREYRCRGWVRGEGE
jgi:hypothetical protein